MNSHSPDLRQDPHWTRIVRRDKSADGTFWYAVATTGIFCRPSCASRLANPANVTLHESSAAAEAAGFRACLRCSPGGVWGGPSGHRWGVERKRESIDRERRAQERVA